MIKWLISFLYKSIKYIERGESEAKALQLSGKHVRCLGDITFNTTKVGFGDNVVLYPGVKICGNNIEIGSNTCIGDDTIIHSSKMIKIGNDVSIAAGCYIIDSNHGIKKDTLIRKQKSEVSESGISIGNDVWLGTQTIVLKGANIGDGAVIGANSIVNSSIPANAIAFGCPAKVHSYRQ